MPLTPVTIHRVTKLDLQVTPWRWPFAEQRRAEIDAYFEQMLVKKPELWNGRLLLGRNPVFTETRLSAQYFETDFASFLAWRDWGFPDKSVFNGFGMGAILCSDGLFVLGEMAQHTVNAGRIYFAAGTPDGHDIAGTRVDIARSVEREVAEETGLAPGDYCADEGWICVTVDSVIAMMRILRITQPGEAVRAAIEANLARQKSPELCRVHLVRDASDFTNAMPRYVTALIAHVAAVGP